MSVKRYSEKGYENLGVCRLGRNKANQSQLKPKPMLRWINLTGLNKLGPKRLSLLGRQVWLEVSLGKSTTRMRLEVPLEGSSSVSKPKCYGNLNPPRCKLRCVVTLSGIMLLQTGIKVLGHSYVVSLGMCKTAQYIDVMESHASGLPRRSSPLQCTLICSSSRHASLRRSSLHSPTTRLGEGRAVAANEDWRRGESNPHFRDATAACSRYTTSPDLPVYPILARPFVNSRLGITVLS
jgi:hypothetical protein